MPFGERKKTNGRDDPAKSHKGCHGNRVEISQSSEVEFLLIRRNPTSCGINCENSEWKDTKKVIWFREKAH